MRSTIPTADAFQASQTETPKRYRYTGMERDEETGFAYHGARYYAPWLARWMSCDPIGVGDWINVYGYNRDNPVMFVDLNGRDSTASERHWGVENGVDLGTWDDAGNYWYTDDVGYTYLWDDPSKKWKLLSTPRDAIHIEYDMNPIEWPKFRKRSWWQQVDDYLKLSDALDEGDYNAPIVKAQGYSAEDLKTIDRFRTFSNITDTVASMAPETGLGWIEALWSDTAWADEVTAQQYGRFARVPNASSRTLSAGDAADAAKIELWQRSEKYGVEYGTYTQNGRLGEESGDRPK